jgi:hypothetical protein
MHRIFLDGIMAGWSGTARRTIMPCGRKERKSMSEENNILAPEQSEG